jgi:hypothetical protein
MPYRDRLPVLELEIATPCTARWEDMSGDDRVRHCGSCRRNVYDLASLTRDEAEALFEQHDGTACVRYFRRYDGTVILRDCTDGMKIRMPPEQIAFWVLMILVGSVSLLMVAWSCANRSRGFGGASLVAPHGQRG